MATLQTNTSKSCEKGQVNAASILEQLFEPLGVEEPSGEYSPHQQTWVHRDWLQFSPVKHNQEM